MSAAEPTESPTVRVVDPVARQLVGALLAGLVLIVPLRAALATSSFGALYGWIGIAAVITVLVGLLLRLAQVPMGLGVALLASAAFMVTAVITLVAVASIGDPGSNVSVALLAGIPAAAVAAPAAVVMARLARDDTGAAVLGAVACVGGLLLAGTAGPGVGGQVEEAREEAATIRAFEEAGLTAYLPEIDGTRVEFSSTSFTRSETGGRVPVGYSLRYEVEAPPGRPFGSAGVSVDVRSAAEPGCEPIPDYLVCLEGDGYVVTERDGVAQEVSAERGDMLLRATVRESEEELPGIDDIGRALADAEEREWADVLGTSD